MSQPVNVMDLMSLASYTPLIAAATLAGLGLFVLRRNHRAAVNQLLGAGMLVLPAPDAVVLRLPIAGTMGAVRDIASGSFARKHNKMR